MTESADFLDGVDLADAIAADLQADFAVACDRAMIGDPSHSEPASLAGYLAQRDASH